ncbi:MAG: cache domain-containing protein [Spirochaetaceae bacterium]
MGDSEDGSAVQDRSVRRRLLNLVFFSSVPLVCLIAIVVTVFALHSWRNTIADVETRTEILHQMVDTAIRESIISYLNAKVETAVSIIEAVDRGRPEEELADKIDAIEEQLAVLNIAETGYIYVVNNKGRVVIHPDPATQGRMIPEVEPVRTQLERKRGYLEYTWQNSFDLLPLPKALYMEEYRSFGWIVAATSYRREFVALIDPQRLARTIGAYSFEAESYSVVVDREGVFVAHPDYPGRQIDEFFDRAEADRLREALFSRPEGRLRYTWGDRPGEGRRPKMMFYRYLPDFDWAIATTVYLDSLRRPFVFLAIGIVLFLAALISYLLFWGRSMAESLSSPIVRLARSAEAGEALSPDALGRHTPREIVSLVERFNAFVERIEEQQNALRKNLQEKTVLIKEIHHRVKNNLQVVASLLSIQSESVRNPEDASLFDRSRDRVISMALVHDQLYQTDNLSLIPFHSYLGELVGHIRNAMGSDGIDIRLECDDVFLEIDRAIPCGLIVNELVTNAIQHAYPKGGTGTIYVVLVKDEDHYHVEVRDLGSGFPAEIRKSLGMTLVEMLSRQINATVALSGSEGAVVRVSIPRAASGNG